MPAAGGASPRKGGQRGRNMPPLSLPNPEELLVETGVDHSGPLTNDSMLGTPTSAREIRARPIDVDKEIPLLFVDDGDPSGGLTPSSSNAELHGSIPASRQDSRGGLSGGGLAGASSTLIVNSSHGALGGISLATALAGNPNAIAIAKAESLAADINIPKCEPDPNYEAPPAARRFRLPVGFLQYKPHPSHERIIEYELDKEDLEWLTAFNVGARQILIDEDRLEEAMDILEKAAFRALHASTPSLLYKHQPPLPITANSGYASTGTGRGGGRGGGAQGNGGVASAARRDLKRSSGHSSSPGRSPKAPKAPKPDRPPPPSDAELAGLPAGLCRRYQQGRCHKGRSCKWKHEMWPELQLRWEAWQKPAKAAAAAAASSAESDAAVAAFPPPTTSGGVAQHTHLSLEALAAKAEDDPLGALALEELGVTSALELVPPSLVPPGMRGMQHRPPASAQSPLVPAGAGGRSLLSTGNGFSLGAQIMGARVAASAWGARALPSRCPTTATAATRSRRSSPSLPAASQARWRRRWSRSSAWTPPLTICSLPRLRGWPTRPPRRKASPQRRRPPSWE